jgi:hypothetical protein
VRAVRAQALAPSPRPVVLRRDPAAFGTRVFDQPFALRALFDGAEPPDPAREIVAMMAAATLEEAVDIADRLERRPWREPQASVVVALIEIACGGRPPSDTWRESREADALRLRLLRDARDPAAAAVGWVSFLQWAGRQLEVAPLARLPRMLASPVVASLAAALGYRRAFEFLMARDLLTGAFAEPAALVALRCALAGEFLPRHVASLMPRARRRQASHRDPWSAALFALRAYRERGTVAGLVHLTAALVAADVRERVATLAADDTAAAMRRPWWEPPDAGHDRALTMAANVLRGGVMVTRPPHGPWGRDRGGPDTAAVVDGVKRVLPWDGGALALEVFLDDRLAVAAVFAAAGYMPSAAAQLAGLSVPPVLARARQALAEGIARPGGSGDAAVLDGRPWPTALERVYRSLAGTPDPSVELGTPHWMLGASRGALVSRLVAEGRAETARMMRSVLDRADLRRDLEAFWILRGSEGDTAAVVGLAEWLAGRDKQVPSQADWIRFAEDACRRLPPSGVEQGRTP